MKDGFLGFQSANTLFTRFQLLYSSFPFLVLINVVVTVVVVVVVVAKTALANTF